MSRRVVITGLGTVSGLGMDAATFWESLVAGRSAIRPLDPTFEDIAIPVAARLPSFDPADYFSSADLSLLDRFSQLAVIASREAVADAGLTDNCKAMDSAATIIGSGCGGKHTDEDTYEKLYKRQRSRAHPLTIPRGMPCAAACMVSMLLGIKGPSFAVSSACASGAHAVIQGNMMIQAGIVDVALVGGTDSPFTYGLLKSWEAMRIATSDTCRPFCADRSGIVLGEGSGMLVLESREHAIARGARIHAELAGFGMTSDANHITRPDVSGITRALNNTLDSTGIDPGEIGYINAHGTATQANDLTETSAIKQVFGTHARDLAISSTKSMHGHALGASSALELIATVYALQTGIIPPTANFTVADQECDLDYVPNSARRKIFDAALSNSFAFGGLNTVLAVRKHN